jgi:hypothetical protein
MWDLLKKNNKGCSKILDLLEETASIHPAAKSIEELGVNMSATERSHVGSCLRCREAAQDILATREIFKRIGPAAEMARQGFPVRVMAAIAARERELSEVASTWLAVPRFASRLAVVSAGLLLVASTWVYEKPLPAQSQQGSSLAAQESLFEAPPPANQDDVLVPVQENNP